MIYLISDHHWGHARILELAGRKFDGLSHMNEHMIKEWNVRVRPDDTVYHLGDIFWHVDVARAIRPRLNGHIKLIKGNHDWWTKELANGEQGVMSEVQRMDIKLLPAIYRLNFNKTKIWMCHYPLRVWEGNFKGAMMIYGHCHGEIEADRLPRSMEISVDVAGYQPWTIEEVWKHLSKDPIMPEELRIGGGLKYTKETSKARKEK